MGNPTTPGVSTSATADITVLVGTATANLDLTLDGGGGGGGISEITSDDHSVTITNPDGPIVDLSVAGSVAGVASFNTRTGAVTATSGDYTVSEVTGAAPLASPALTGTPTAPTKTPGTNNTDLATTAYSDLGVGVETTRAEAAEALLAPKASPALTGTPTTPTATVGTNTTQIASTAFVLANAGSGGGLLGIRSLGYRHGHLRRLHGRPGNRGTGWTPNRRCHHVRCRRHSEEHRTRSHRPNR